jgi:translocation and assembly module TamA
MLTAALSIALVLQARADIPYRTNFNILAPDDLAEQLRTASRLRTDADNIPSTFGGLRRRASADRETLETVLRASGYFAGQVDIRIDETTPALVTVTIDSGPLYRFGTITIEGAPDDEATQEAQENLRKLEIHTQAAAESAPVIAAGTALVESLRKRGFPFARLAERRATVRHADQTMDVLFRLDPGNPARFGTVKISGTRRIRARYIERRLAWKRGEIYDATLVETTRRTLAETGLFDLIRIETEEPLAPDGTVTMRIEATERKLRTLGAGARYSTSQGFGLQGLWEHRALFGGAEQLRLTAEASQQRQGLDTDFRKPDFLARRLDLVSSLRLSRETPSAFRTVRARGTAGLEYARSDRLRFGSSLEAEISRQTRAALTRSASGRETFRLFALPSFARYDTTDALLDPTRGLRAQITLTPTIIVGANASRFLTAQATASTYVALNEPARTVLAGWVNVGSILGSPTIDVPSDRRFYAGGGGSVRGYGYQRVGPLDAADKPTGGRSLVAFGGEIRQRILENWGVTGFVEAGSVSRSAAPSISSRLSVGAGFGVLYYTPIGPIRADVAMPLNRRRGDNRVHFYISFGQAF